MVKVGYFNVRVYGNDRYLFNFRGYYRFGFYIVFLDDNDEINDKDYDEKILWDKDLRFYGFIGLFFVEYELCRMYYLIYYDDFFFLSVVLFF